MTVEILVEVEYFITKHGKNLKESIWDHLIQIIFQISKLPTKQSKDLINFNTRIMKILKIIAGDFLSNLSETQIESFIDSLFNFQSFETSVNNQLTISNLFWNIILNNE